MDFEFSEDQLRFHDEVERFLDEHEDISVMDPTRENMAQIVDTPARRDCGMAQASPASCGVVSASMSCP